jgi:hypothetical protein
MMDHGHRAGADPEDPHAPRRTALASASLADPWPAHTGVTLSR